MIEQVSCYVTALPLSLEQNSTSNFTFLAGFLNRLREQVVMAANRYPSSIILICFSNLHLQFHFRRCSRAGLCIQVTCLGLTLGVFKTGSRRLHKGDRSR